MSSTWHPASASPPPSAPLPSATPGPAPLGTDRDCHPLFRDPGATELPGVGTDAYGASAEGAVWLASASAHPRSTLALWQERPAAPVVLPCGQTFDVVNAPAVFGRRMLDRLWEEGAGSGPVATHRGRVLLFAAPGTAARLPSLLHWEEWGSAGTRTRVPALLCHGPGDAVTVPPPAAAPAPTEPAAAGARLDSRWLVPPGGRHPWLPGPDVMLWAAVRAARTGGGRGGEAEPGGTEPNRGRPQPSPGARVSIFPGAEADAKVYDVSRRR